MGRWRRVLRGIGLALLLLAAVLLVVLAVYRELAMPVLDGRLRVDGLSGQVTIGRDAHGVPRIEAASPEGAWFGLGFVHAQDRLWQLELQRRVGAGRLAEAFGPAALDNDRFLRALGVREAAQAQWERADAETRRALEAYAAGINAYLDRHLRARPPEFLLLGLWPERWTPVDSLAWSIMMAWDLGANWNSELLRLRLAGRLSLARIRELLPPYPGEAPLASADYTTMARDWQALDPLLQRLAEAAPPSGLEGTGSNNWAVDGRRSRSGRPLLANDPHLKLGTPALWYLARLEAPGLAVAGATLPGLPMVVLGQNRAIAWGYTNTAPDVQDLYLERLDPVDPGRYRTPEGWARFETRETLIAVRGAEPVRFTVRRSRHGPVLSDAGLPVTQGLTGGHAPAAPRYALALRWTALDADNRTLSAGLRFNRAESIEAYAAAALDYGAPMQNMLVADGAGPHGRIALVVPGRVPVRGPDHDLRGLVPAPGWEARYDWQGLLPATALPQRIDPPEGWLATANQRIVGPDSPHFLTSEWTLPYRQQRIEVLLGARPRHDVASFLAMQNDRQSLAAQPLLGRFRAARGLPPLAPPVEAARQAFDGDMSGDSAAAAVFQVWVATLTRRVFADELGPAWAFHSERRSFRDALEGVLARDDAWWCDDKNTAAPETCAMQADRALEDTLAELRQRLGDDPTAWRWDRLHRVHAEHRPFSRVGLLRRLFELQGPVGGDSYSIDATRVNLRAEPGSTEAYATEHGPSLRAVYDLAEPAGSRIVLAGGQSGLVFSPHYRDQFARWLRGEAIALWSGESPRHRLVLIGREGPE